MGRDITAAVSAGVFAVALVVIGGAAPQAAGPASAKATNTFTTMTGCLHSDGERFMLTDAKGEQAPTRRSWKTGFITKGAKDVEVVSAMSNLKLKDHVGHQVRVIGLKDGDTQLRARTVSLVAKKCE